MKCGIFSTIFTYSFVSQLPVPVTKPLRSFTYKEKSLCWLTFCDIVALILCGKIVMEGYEGTKLLSDEFKMHFILKMSRNDLFLLVSIPQRTEDGFTGAFSGSLSKGI